MDRQGRKPEVVNAQLIAVNSPLYEAGNYNDVRQDLKRSMSESLNRIKLAAHEIKRICAAEADLVESAVEDRKRSYAALRDEIRETGV